MILQPWPRAQHTNGSERTLATRSEPRWGASGSSPDCEASHNRGSQNRSRNVLMLDPRNGEE